MENTATQEMIIKLIAWVEGAQQFVIGQAPDYIQQYLKMTMYQCWIDTISAFLLFIFCIIMSVWSIRTVNAYEENWKAPFLAQWISWMAPISCIGTIAFFVGELKKLVSISIAPKVYILQHLKELLT